MRKRGFRAVLRVLALFAVLVPLNASVEAWGQSRAPHWVNILYEKFEATVWPPTSSKWYLRDDSYNSAQGFWDDNSQRGFNSSWSANPADAATYRPNMHTGMRYGPFSLAGATDARMIFKYWLDTEAQLRLLRLGLQLHQRVEHPGGVDWADGVGEWPRDGAGVGKRDLVVEAVYRPGPCVGAVHVHVRL